MHRHRISASVAARAGLLVVLLQGCAGTLSPGGAGVDVNRSDWARQSQVDGVPLGVWTHQTFGDRKPTLFLPEWLDGRAAVHAHSAGGNSSLRAALPVPGVARLRFSWWVARLNAEADLRDGDVDDAVARVVLTFDGERETRFTARDHLLSELARLVTGEPLPYATLVYVWDNRYPVGTVIPNPHSNRIRQLVVESGPERLGRWVDVERDVQADYRQVFGEAPGALHSVGVMSDTNNTGATVDAWFGPVVFTAGSGPR